MVEFEKKLNENKSECRTARMFVYHEWPDARAMRCEDTTLDYDINPVIQSQPVLDLFGVGGFTPLWCLSTPQVFIDPSKKLSK